MLHCSWDMHDGCNYFSFWAIFCPFTAITAWKIKILKKWKKAPGDIIILHMRPKNYDQMMYGSWDMVRDGWNFFSVWAIFCPFIAITAWKIKILKTWKKHLEISSFYICVPEIMIVYPHNSLKNQNFEKNEKNTWRYHHFTYLFQKLWSDDVRLLR